MEHHFNITLFVVVYNDAHIVNPHYQRHMNNKGSKFNSNTIYKHSLVVIPI